MERRGDFGEATGLERRVGVVDFDVKVAREVKDCNGRTGLGLQFLFALLRLPFAVGESSLPSSSGVSRTTNWDLEVEVMSD